MTLSLSKITYTMTLNKPLIMSDSKNILPAEKQKENFDNWKLYLVSNDTQKANECISKMDDVYRKKAQTLAAEILEKKTANKHETGMGSTTGVYYGDHVVDTEDDEETPLGNVVRPVTNLTRNVTNSVTGFIDDLF